MTWLGRWYRRLRGLASGPEREREMDDEIRFHLAMERDALIASGMSPREAERRARLAFGGVERVKEDGRDARGGRWIEDLARDLRGAVRSLLGSPGYSAVMILSLAVGVGASATIFGVVNGVLLKPLPYADPSRLLLIWDGLDMVGVPEAWLTGPEIETLRSDASTLAGVSVFQATRQVVTVPGGDPRQLEFTLVSSDFFDLLGTPPALGRGFRPDEDRPGSPLVVVLSHDYWRSAFAGDSGVIGGRIELDDSQATVIGVLPERFHFATQSSLGTASGAAFYANLRIDLAAEHPGSHGFGGLARVAPGVSLDRARSELAVISARLDREVYGSRGFRFVSIGLHERLVREVRPALLVVLGAIGVLLAIMSANLATLTLTRFSRRGREFAVRAAIGAGRARLVRQVLAETLVCAAAGGLLAGGVAWLGLRALVGAAPADLPRLTELGVDPVVLGVGLLLAIAVGVATSLLPALGTARRSPAMVLRQASPAIGGRRAPGALVVGQVALSTVLLATAGLLLASLARLMRTDPGFATHGVLLARLDLRPSAYPDNARVAELYRELTARAAELPGVLAAGAVSSSPLSAATQQRGGRFRPPVASDDGESFLFDAVWATPGYLEAMGIGLVEGRDLAPGPDRMEVLIDETLARRHFAGGSAVGRAFYFEGDTTRLEIVGVTRHARLYDLGADDRGQVYVPHAIMPRRTMTLVLKADDPSALAASVRELVRGVDPGQPLTDLTTIAARVDRSLAERRLVLSLLAGFALAALGLATMGIYGVTSSAVAERMREMGIRSALGADGRRLVWTALRRPLGLIGLGLALGLGGVAALSGLVRGLLYGVAPTDPATLIGVVVLLTAAGTLAGTIPASRLTRCDPLAVLRAD
ncbi:MAG: ABC transporter permease [Gemmatimonadales bacterium]